MKALSVYNFEDKLEIDLDKVLASVHTELTDLQIEGIGFCELYDEKFLEKTLEGYSIAKVRQSKRKEVKGDTVEREFNRRMKKLAREEVSFDLDQLLEEVNQDLTRVQDITTKSFMLVVDHLNFKVFVDAPRALAEEALGLLHGVLVEDVQFEVLLTDQAIMQKLLTSYVAKPLNVPEPMVLGYHVEMGSKTTVGEKAPSSNVIIKNEAIEGSDEVTKHLTSGKVVNKLEIDNDVIFFKIDNTFFINGIKFEGSLKYKEDTDISAGLNFLAEWQQKLPEVSKMVSILETEIKNVGV